MQGYMCNKYYLKIFFYLKNKFHPYTRLKKIIDKLEKLFKFKCIVKK